MTPTNFLAPIRERLKKATPGLGEYSYETSDDPNEYPDYDLWHRMPDDTLYDVGQFRLERDAQFYAACKADLSRLIEVVEAQANVIAAHRELFCAEENYEDHSASGGKEAHLAVTRLVAASAALKESEAALTTLLGG